MINPLKLNTLWIDLKIKFTPSVKLLDYLHTIFLLFNGTNIFLELMHLSSNYKGIRKFSLVFRPCFPNFHI